MPFSLKNVQMILLVSYFTFIKRLFYNYFIYEFGERRGNTLKQLIINWIGSEKRMASLEDGRVTELHIQQPNNKEAVGNIYVGRIINVLPGMQAAFVDIGFDKNGYLHRNDCLEYHLSPLPPDEKNSKSISHFVREGEEIIVQVSKERFGNKGPKLTGNIEIPGNYLVYMPYGNYVAVSRKMNKEKAKELRTLAEQICQYPEGVIFRTASENAERDVIVKEYQYLKNMYQHILRKKEKSKVPALLYSENDIVERIFREREPYDHIIIDDFHVYRELKNRCNDLGNNITQIEYYSNKQNIFSAYRIDQVLENALKQIVWLKNGAYIVIEQTEALTVIDVNTGKYLGKTNLSETVLKTNEEAALEIARQIRIRDIGGIILIDFIDMKSSEDKKRILEILQQLFENDKARVHVYGFTNLGIVEISRKKVRPSLYMTLTEKCPCCKGTGRILSNETVAYQIERILWEHRGMEHEAIWIETTEPVKQCLSGQDDVHLQRLEEALRFKLYVTVNSNMKEGFTIRRIGTIADIETAIQQWNRY
jgi:ribonuclease G